MTDGESRPSFLVTIDTEGDNLWSRPRVIRTRNANYLERFQCMCESYGLRPTWLADHDMVHASEFKRFARSVLADGSAEIGMHLHAWSSPPIEPLTQDDWFTQPYLFEYSPRIMREKIRGLTGTLEDTLGVKMLSHRAGRWGFDERYAEVLIEEGYVVDCSVTPLVTWRNAMGNPTRNGGPDYRGFQPHPYWLDPGDISKSGSSPLLEVPVSIVPAWPARASTFFASGERLPQPIGGLASLTHRAAQKLAPEIAWLRPNGRNPRQLRHVLQRVIVDRLPCAEFVLHSSELMAGGSPTFPTESSIERLYADLERLFQEVRSLFVGATLAEFHRRFAAGTPAPDLAGHVGPGPP